MCSYINYQVFHVIFFLLQIVIRFNNFNTKNIDCINIFIQLTIKTKKLNK